jgi:hypothetical protein
MEGGWPYRWCAPLVARWGPRGALPWLALVALCAWFLPAVGTWHFAYTMGHREGDVAGRSEGTRRLLAERAENLDRRSMLNGVVTDGVNPVVGATVMVINTKKDRAVKRSTVSEGRYTIDLHEIGVDDNAIIRLEATTETHEASDQFLFKDGPQLRSVLRKKK